MKRWDIINSLIKKHNYKSYLEIGVDSKVDPGSNWPKIEIELKHGVDPDEHGIAEFKYTSDEFFDKHIKQKYDIIFVDGLHVFEQVYRDIFNSLNYLNDNGTIVVHDCLPPCELAQRPVRESGNWNGDVWKAIVKLNTENENLQVVTVDTDEGCAIIRRGSQKLLNLNELNLKPEDLYNYEVFQHIKPQLLKLISISDFKEKYLS